MKNNDSEKEGKNIKKMNRNKILQVKIIRIVFVEDNLGLCMNL